jgi:broad specificity phosphatase PhoE
VVRPRWTSGPREITLVRHGHSRANQADAEARDAGAESLELDRRDADVVLSATGRTEADRLAAWLAREGAAAQPTLVISSPYRRTVETAEHIVAGLGIELVHDERLRERELGLFDGLTGVGIRSRHPEEAERRKQLGKFYYQPPYGESLGDVCLRVRSLLEDLRHGYDGARLWLVTHQAVIMSFRYVLEELSEEALLDIDRRVQIPNASLTTYRRDGDALELVAFADASVLEEAGP